MSETRADDEIIRRVAEVERVDFFGTISADLIGYLPFSAAKPFLKDTVTEADWKAAPRDGDSIRAQIVDYLPFAWDKANNCRGLSAARSLNHMQAWLWMLGEDAVAAEIGDYSLYGKPQLRAISERFGFDWRAQDDGHWVNNEGEDGEAADDVPALALPWLPALPQKDSTDGG